MSRYLANGILFLLVMTSFRGLATSGRLSIQVAEISKDFFAHAPDRTSRNLMELCYESVENWQKVTAAHIQPAPGLPGCSYLGQGGHEENDVRPVAYAALVNSFVAKVERTQLASSRRHRAIAGQQSIELIRYLVQSHVTRSGACINGKKWGSQWQSAMWARSLGLAAWFLWKDLPADLQQGTAALIAFEADRFVSSQPKSSVRNDTGAEENAWNAQILSLAAGMFPQDPRSGAWNTAAKRWMYNSLSVAADRQDTSPGDDGRRVKDWVNTTNVHSDFTIENHGLVHVGYLKTSASLLVENILPYLLSGAEIPQAATHHARECFDVLLRCMAWDGAAIYVSGNDWKLFHTQSTDAMLYAFMNLFGADPRAAYLEQVALDYTLKIQRAEQGFYNMRRDLESGGLSATRLIAAYLAHAAVGAGSRPGSRSAFDREISGVFFFPDGKFVTHRTASQFVSACLSQKRMFLALPRNGSWLVWPHFASGFGYINGLDASSRNAKLSTSEILTNANGFKVAGVIQRTNASAEQTFFLDSTIPGAVVYIERLRGTNITTRESGVVGIEFPLGGNSRTIFTEKGRKVIVGEGGSAPVVRPIQSNWLNVENQIGYVVKRIPEMANVMRYHDEVHGTGRVPKLEEWLSLVGEAEARVLNGTEQWSCIVTFLNQRASSTARHAKEVEFHVEGNVARCRVAGREVSAEFRSH